MERRRVHSLIGAARQGFKILLIGHEGHPEVVGVVGEAPGDIFISGLNLGSLGLSIKMVLLNFMIVLIHLINTSFEPTVGHMH